MRNRINGLRKLLSEKITAAGIEKDFSFLQRQSGHVFLPRAFSGPGHAPARRSISIYTVDSARVKRASFNDSNIDYFVQALKTVL